MRPEKYEERFYENVIKMMRLRTVCKVNLFLFLKRQHKKRHNVVGMGKMWSALGERYESFAAMLVAVSQSSGGNERSLTTFEIVSQPERKR